MSNRTVTDRRARRGILIAPRSPSRGPATTSARAIRNPRAATPRGRRRSSPGRARTPTARASPTSAPAAGRSTAAARRWTPARPRSAIRRRARRACASTTCAPARRSTSRRNKGRIVGDHPGGNSLTCPSPTVAPFVTNATGVAVGLNADRVDSLNAGEIIAQAVAAGAAGRRRRRERLPGEHDARRRRLHRDGAARGGELRRRGGGVRPGRSPAGAAGRAAACAHARRDRPRQRRDERTTSPASRSGRWRSTAASPRAT